MRLGTRQSPEDQMDVGSPSKPHKKLQNVSGWRNDIIQLHTLKVTHTNDWSGTMHEWSHGHHPPCPFWVLLWVHGNVGTCIPKMQCAELIDSKKVYQSQKFRCVLLFYGVIDVLPAL